MHEKSIFLLTEDEVKERARVAVGKLETIQHAHLYYAAILCGNNLDRAKIMLQWLEDDARSQQESSQTGG